MTVLQLKEILSAELLCGGDHLDREVHTACGSDMMSDVLAFVKEQAVLLTGLVNPQGRAYRRNDGYESHSVCARQGAG